MEVPMLGVKSELQLPVYTTATATTTWDLSHVCDLHHSLWQCHLPKPLSEAGDQTCILLNTCVCYLSATVGTPKEIFFWSRYFFCLFFVCINRLLIFLLYYQKITDGNMGSSVWYVNPTWYLNSHKSGNGHVPSDLKSCHLGKHGPKSGKCVFIWGPFLQGRRVFLQRIPKFQEILHCPLLLSCPWKPPALPKHLRMSSGKMQPSVWEPSISE